MPNNKRVYYNDKEIQNVDIIFRIPNIEGHLITDILDYPDMLEHNDPEEWLNRNHITQARINETSHFVEITLMNDTDTILNVRKIPYESVAEINILSKESVGPPKIPINKLSKSEKSSLK